MRHYAIQQLAREVRERQEAQVAHEARRAAEWEAEQQAAGCGAQDSRTQRIIRAPNAAGLGRLPRLAPRGGSSRLSHYSGRAFGAARGSMRG